MTVRRVYLDTEFLPADPTNRGLVSIGLTDDRGRSYYAVNRDMDTDAVLAVPWMVNNVWRFLPRMNHPRRGHPSVLDLAHQDVKPLETIRGDVTRYFADTDASEARLYAYDAGNPRLPEQPAGAHHALADAEHNRRIHEHLMTLGRERAA
ncbi:hypothetical protein ACH4TP_38035 [Streptomyces sp. NPDC021012]|uniref:hypothetical protein n=1 Tax=Streptomyces sp. NPDC021012 TaxID=3365107 RepID=UPI0037AA71A4